MQDNLRNTLVKTNRSSLIPHDHVAWSRVQTCQASARRLHKPARKRLHFIRSPHLHLCAHAGLGQWASGLLRVPGAERVGLLRRRLRPVLLLRWRHRLLLRCCAPGKRMPRGCQAAPTTAAAAAATRTCTSE